MDHKAAFFCLYFLMQASYAENSINQDLIHIHTESIDRLYYSQ